jgi:hypothetical protein
MMAEVDVGAVAVGAVFEDCLVAGLDEKGSAAAAAAAVLVGSGGGSGGGFGVEVAIPKK